MEAALWGRRPLNFLSKWEQYPRQPDDNDRILTAQSTRPGDPVNGLTRSPRACARDITGAGVQPRTDRCARPSLPRRGLPKHRLADTPRQFDELGGGHDGD